MANSAIGVFTPEQAKLIWDDYLKRNPANPQRRPIDEPQTHRVRVKNTEDEVIPPYACMRIIGVETVGDVSVLKVEKPTKITGDFLFNSPYEIPVVGGVGSSVTGIGWAYRYGVVIMLGDEPADPVMSYQPIVDSWEVEEGEGPFVVWGRHEANDRALIGRITARHEIHFYLGESLAAPANPRTAWTTARAYVYRETDTGDLEYTEEQVIVSNRYTGVSGAAGQYGQAKLGAKHWTAYTLDCEVDGAWSPPEALSIDADPGPGD